MPTLEVRPDGIAPVTLPLVFAPGASLSNPVTLPGTELMVQVPAAAAAGAQWRIEANATPADDLGLLAARLEALDGGVLAALFGVDPAEPYRTWQRIWADRDGPLPDRLGAVLLALAGRTAEWRRLAGAPGG